jgi:uncharacterized membrane protein HdeD (DUF308 family)
MLELLARNWAWVLARGVFTILFGALAVFWPEITLVALVVLYGAYAVVDGITALVMGIRRSSGRGFLILVGVLGIVAGLIALLWPGITAIALLYLIAVWAIVMGVGSIVSAFGLAGDPGGRWLFVLSGLAGIVLGVLLIAAPGRGAVALVVTIGFFAIVWGLITVMTSVRLRRLAEELDARRALLDIYIGRYLATEREVGAAPHTPDRSHMRRLPSPLRTVLAFAAGVLFAIAAASPAAAAPIPFTVDDLGEDGCTHYEASGTAEWPDMGVQPTVAFEGKASTTVADDRPCLDVVPFPRHVRFTAHSHDWPVDEHREKLSDTASSFEFAFELNAEAGVSIDYVTVAVCLTDDLGSGPTEICGEPVLLQPSS